MAQAAGRVAPLILAITLVAGTSAFAADTPKGPSWQQLTVEQQGILEPLQESWDSLSIARKRKWIEVTKRYPRLKPQEQGRLRVQMKDWAALTPEQRREARDAYRKFAELPVEQRQAVRERWERAQEEKRREASVQREAGSGGEAASGDAPADGGAAKPADAPPRN